MKKLLLLIIISAMLLAGCGDTSQPAGTTEVSAESSAVSSASSLPAEEEGTPAQQTTEQTENAPAEEPEEEQPDDACLAERAGVYFLNSMIQGGETMKASDVAEMESYGMQMKLILKKDGTGFIKVFGETLSFSWDDKTMTIEEEEPVDYTWNEKGEVSFSFRDTDYVFSKEKAEDIAKAGKEKAAEEAGTAAGDSGTDAASDPDGSASGQDGNQGGDHASIADITITGADWVKESSGETILVVWYEFTNNTDGFLSPYAFNAEAHQDGTVYEDRDAALSEDETIEETDNRYMQIQPGAKNRSVFFFGADPDGNEIIVTVKDTDSGAVLSQETLTPKTLPGTPEKDFVPQETQDVTLPDDVKAEGTYNESYTLSIKSSETVTAEDSGEEMIRVWFEFTNDSDETVSPYMVVYLRAVQDGLALNTGWSSLTDEQLDKIYDDVAPGKSLQFCYEWYLVSDSPVAVEAYDWFSEETELGKVFEI